MSVYVHNTYCRAMCLAKNDHMIKTRKFACKRHSSVKSISSHYLQLKNNVLGNILSSKFGLSVSSVVHPAYYSDQFAHSCCIAYICHRQVPDTNAGSIWNLISLVGPIWFEGLILIMVEIIM